VWELICHHEYCWGTIAADRSPWHSDGIPAGVQPLPGSQVGLTFSTPQSKIAIPRKAGDPWGYLHALNVEIIARFAQAGGTLIDGRQSFRIWMTNQHTVVAEVPGGSFALTGLPMGQWASITFQHNGFNQMGGGYSYPIPAGSGPGGGGGAQPTTGQVPGVGPQGVLIGNRIGNPGEHWRGDIAMVKVWRSNPRTMNNEFLARPLDPALSACWTEFIRKFNEALRNNPNCLEWLMSTVKQLQQKFTQALAQKSQEKIAEFRKMCLEYRDLHYWRQWWRRRPTWWRRRWPRFEWSTGSSGQRGERAYRHHLCAIGTPRYDRAEAVDVSSPAFSQQAVTVAQSFNAVSIRNA